LIVHGAQFFSSLSRCSECVLVCCTYCACYNSLQDACVSAKTQAACEQMKVIPVNVGSFLRSTDMQNLTAGSGVACIL
jgi:hypothetical protein